MVLDGQAGLLTLSNGACREAGSRGLWAQWSFGGYGTLRIGAQRLRRRSIARSSAAFGAASSPTACPGQGALLPGGEHQHTRGPGLRMGPAGTATAWGLRRRWDFLEVGWLRAPLGSFMGSGRVGSKSADAPGLQHVVIQWVRTVLLLLPPTLLVRP